MRLELKSDIFVIIPGNTLFSSENIKPFNQLYVHFSVCVPFTEISNKIMVFKINEVENFYFKNIISSVRDSANSSINFSLYVHSFIDYALARIPEHDFKSSRKIDPRILKAINIFDKNISRIISNEEMAQMINISTNGFIRLFTSETDTSPQKYHRNKRIEKACLLLHFSEKNIDEIAIKTGFLDRYHFSREFKKSTSNTPAEFRKTKGI